MSDPAESSLVDAADRAAAARAAGRRDSPRAAKESRKEAVKSAVTPMMAQYLEIKQANPDSLLFYRMGDFYEMFLEDAVAAAAALDIALTKRGQHLGEDLPMCGVPVHAAEAYLSKLIRKGFKVAICEQMEDPAEARRRGGKAVVRRDVIRLVTPGTVTEDELLDARANNYLVALSDAGGALGLAWLDISTGDFQVQPVATAGLAAALARLRPGELLLPDRLLRAEALCETLAGWKAVLSPLPSARFDSGNAGRRLERLYGVKALDAFGGFSRAELAAAGALVDYVELTQKGRLPRFGRLRRLSAGAVMEIDAATRRNLELTESLTGGRKGSLLATIDRSVTGAGARLLADRLAAPLTDPAAIEARLDGVQALRDEEGLREALRAGLKRCPDIERALARLTVGRGGPRDLAALRDALAQAAALRALLERERPWDLLAAGRCPGPPELARAAGDLGHHQVLVERLTRALAESPPTVARDGGFIAAGYHDALDELRGLRDESRKLIAGLQARYAGESGVASLKIKHNNVLGYFIEVTASNAEKLGTEKLGTEKPGAEKPGSAAGGPFIHRQTMANAMRFTTVELGELERKIASAADKALALEQELFDDLVREVLERQDEVALAASALARLDVTAGLAEIAAEARWCRPAIDESAAFTIAGGRHPVVEAALAAAQDGRFMANDCDLAAARRLWLVTGPNMAGKSTFLRQNALIAVLAQCGAFVPAEAATVGVVDRLFSRVGAADDLARGRSTFMVEMVEAAAILNQATPRSLVILDEIGRGTATFDGLSIAWACVEHLHEVNRCRALFATHYHELTALAGKLDALACHAMRVKEWRGEIVFLHEVAAGAADRSYGIHVAKLAGLPPAVIGRAEEVLKILEQGEQAGSLRTLADDLPLFAARPKSGPATPGPAEPSAAETRLAEINPDELTPRAALDLLYELRGLLADE